MRRLNGLVFAMAAISLAACSGSTNLSGTGGSATGGNTRAEGGSGGSGGAGGNAQPTDGGVRLLDAATDGPVCPTASGPLTSWDTPRPTFPWKLSSPDIDGGFASSAVASGCQDFARAGEPYVLCSGSAWLRAGSTGITLAWDDGSLLTWDPTGLAQPFTAPIAPGAPDQRVWAELERRNHVDCESCSKYVTNTMDIRDSAGGKILFLARQGVRLDDLTPDQTLDVFGVGAEAVATCSFTAQTRCLVVTRTNQDHSLATTPAQLIPHAVPTRVTSPNGTFDVIWHASIDSIVAGTCAEGPTVANDTGFVASRIAP